MPGKADIVFWTLLGLGYFYLPMSLLAVVLWNSMLAMNPLQVLAAIAKLPIHYYAMVLVLG